MHAKHVRQIAPCAVLGAGFSPQNAAGDGGLSYSEYVLTHVEQNVPKV